MVDYPILIRDPLDDELRLWLCPHFHLWCYPRPAGGTGRWRRGESAGSAESLLDARWQVVAQGAEEVRRWLDAHAGSAGSVDGAPSTAFTA